MSRTILVTGATGQQGRALVDALFSSHSSQPPFKVLALTRNTQSPSAAAIAAKYPKVSLLRGDLDDCNAIFDSAKEPIWGVFSVQVFAGGNATLESEEKQGNALIDASIAHGVKHFVYASVDRGGDRSEDDPTPVPHFASKYRVEQYLKKKTTANDDSQKPSDMTWTILRPVAFMENLKPGFMTKAMITSLKITRARTLRIHLISCADIGWFAAEAFRKPEEYRNKAFSLAGDSLDLNELDQVFVEKTGHKAPSTFNFVARGFFYWLPEFGKMFKWLGENPYTIDVEGLRKIHPGLMTLGTWMEQNGYAKK
ncbi:MAG: hypothetical protein M1837_002105 [Sclerophora amabilis]|nr:MAG: hypothetical protein M1837_002105 [Sclerophora amabilis]